MAADGENLVAGAIEWRFCEECKGTGIVSCCEGTERQAGVADDFMSAPQYGDGWKNHV